MTRRFKSFKLLLSKATKGLSALTRSYDTTSAVTKVFSTLNRLPTVTFEQKFLSVFGLTKSDFPDSEDVIPNSLNQRDKSAELFCGQKIEDNYLNYPALIAKVQIIISKQLSLEGKKFVPATLDKAIDCLPTNTSSGFPLYKSPKGDIKQGVLNLAKQCLNEQDVTWTYFITTMAWRTQTRMSGIKLRIIWVVPYLVQVFESCFAQPFFQHFDQNRNTSYCYGNVFTDISPRLAQLRKYVSILSLDFSNFDMTVPVSLIANFFHFLKQHTIIVNESWNMQFTAVVRYACFAQVAVLFKDRDLIFSKDASVLSGSVFTNFLGSYVNLFVINFCLLRMGIDPLTCCMNVLGDDNLLGLPCDIDISQLALLAKKHFGMIINAEKSNKYAPDFDTVEFLGAKMNEFGRYSNDELIIKQLCVTGRWIPSDSMSEEERLVSKLASNCFRFKDGHLFFDHVMKKLLPHLNLVKVPDYYYQIFNSPAGPYNTLEIRSIADYKYHGWMRQ